MYVATDAVPPSMPLFDIGDNGVEMSGDVFPQQVKIKKSSCNDGWLQVLLKVVGLMKPMTSFHSLCILPPHYGT